MSADKIILGRTVRDLDESPSYDPISCIRLITGTDQNGNQIVYTAGDPKSGRTLDVENRLIRDPTQGQQVANNILAAVQGYAYKPFNAAGAILDPAAEIGDGVSVDEVYSVLADIETTFSPLMSANIGAPEDGSIDHEYPYESSENRLIAQEIQGLRTSFIVENGKISAEISDVQQTQRGIQNNITQLELTVNGIHAYTDQEIEGIVDNWAEVNITPEYIQSEVSEYFDAAGAADAALRAAKKYTDDEIEPISGQYTSKIEQTAMEIKATVAAQESKWDLTGLPAGVTISAYGYGQPLNDNSPSYKYRPAAYTNKYYLDQNTGFWYKSNGSTWTKQTGSLKLITTNLSSMITSTASGLESVVEEIGTKDTDGTILNRLTKIEQTSTDITLSVYSNTYGETYFKLSDGSGEISSASFNFATDILNVAGNLTAKYIAANVSISSPFITGATIQSSRFSDQYNVTALTMGNDSWSDGFLWFGPYSNASYPSLSNSYFRVRGYNNYVEFDLGGRAFMGTQQNSWVLSLGGTWDFSQATRVIMPDGTIFQ